MRREKEVDGPAVEVDRACENLRSSGLRVLVFHTFVRTSTFGEKRR